MAPSPYSYVTSGGVSNTRVRVASEGATLDTLHDLFATPVQIDVASITYHNGSKKDRSNVKKALSYFVGGTFDPPQRHDDNVQARTLLTLDVEQGEHNDSPPPSPDVVAARLAALDGSGWVYTSLSHTPKSPRYRVVLPLGKPIQGGTVESMGAILKASTIAAAQKLGVEEWTQPESWVLSQPMYLPAKLKGGTFYQNHRAGKAWSSVDAAPRTGPADFPDHTDPTLNALKAAGLYLGEAHNHKGKHFITCPFHAQHDAENETQTVYYEAHHDGNPRPAVKCFDTAPDDGGVPHLTYATLVHALRGSGAAKGELDDRKVLDDYETFRVKADLSRLLDGATIPQEWAVAQFAPVGRVTVLAGPGGQGKSLFGVHLMAHLACGLPFGLQHLPPDSPALRSLYVSYEDGTSQLQARTRRVAHNIEQRDDKTYGLLHDVAGQMRSNMQVYAADDDAAEWLLLTKPDRNGQPAPTDRVDWLIGYLKKYRVRMLTLDPVVYTHQLNENDIADMSSYMQTLSRIAREANLAVVVLHHMSKTGGFGVLDTINQNSMRGASSIADNARSVFAGVMMPQEDCLAYGINPDERHNYFVLKHVKHNYSAPLPLQVFHNVDGVMVYRPEIRKQEASVLAEAKEALKTQQDDFKR